MKKFPRFFLITDLIFLNIALAVVGYLLFFRQGSSINSTPSFFVSQPTPFQKDKITDACGSECKKYIDEKVLQYLGTNITPTAPVKKSTSNKVKRITYVPIPGSGNTLNTDWTTLAGTDFYLSKGDFAGLIGVYFEANMSLANGNGVAYARVYDKTHEIAVVGSEGQTSSQTSVFVSAGPLNLWEGYNQYQVQLKSLTADTAIFESGKLKIITEE